MNTLVKRLPDSQSILQVYAVIAVMLSGWTITAFLWKLSAWLLILTIGEIFTVFSYSMVANLIESIVVLLLILAISVLLPPALLRDDFVVRGTILSASIIGSLMAYVRLHMQFGMEGDVKLLLGPLVVLFLTAILLIFPPRYRFVRYVRAAVLLVSDRLIIFLYLLVPLFLTLFIYVIFRNIT